MAACRIASVDYMCSGSQLLGEMGRDFFENWPVWCQLFGPDPIEAASIDKYPVPKDAAGARDDEIKEATNQSSPESVFQEKGASSSDKQVGAAATTDTVGG